MGCAQSQPDTLKKNQKKNQMNATYDQAIASRRNGDNYGSHSGGGGSHHHKRNDNNNYNYGGSSGWQGYG